jgi:hypothetical protein
MPRPGLGIHTQYLDSYQQKNIESIQMWNRLEQILYTIIATFFFFITTPHVLITIPEKAPLIKYVLIHGVVYFIAVYFCIRTVNHLLTYPYMK